MKQHRNLFVDICNMAEQNQDKFRKVYDDMYALRETWVDINRKEGKIEGIKEGIIKGKKEGKKEGIKEGIKEGKNEGKVEIVLNMIKENLTDEIISRYSDFSIEEIAKIRKDYSNR